MCIIAVKPEGISIDDDIIWACWHNNPHGAGMMFRVKEGVQIVKGFMTLDSLGDYINEYRKFLEENMVVFHFRIGTHGLNNTANTHPFPMSSLEGERSASNLITPAAFVHNGILLNKGNKVDSDTYELANNLSFIPQDNRLKFLSKLGGPANKFAVMDKDRTTVIGDFESEYGWHFSNYSYEVWTPQPVHPSCMDAWDDDDMLGRTSTSTSLGTLGECLECGASCDKGICDSCWEEYQKAWEED